MPRFRRKSETKRPGTAPEMSSQTVYSHEVNVPLALPPASDFRTSLILPSLSRRFTILRNSAGEPLSPSQVRQRLAEQRSRGEAIHISEEEENMMIEALERMRTSSSAIVPQESSSTAAAGSAQSYLADSSEPQTPPPRPRDFASSSPSVSPGSLNGDLGGSLFSSSSARLHDERQFRLASKTSDRSLQPTANNLPSPTTLRVRESTNRAIVGPTSSTAPIDSFIAHTTPPTVVAPSLDGAEPRGIHDPTGDDIENLTPSSAHPSALTPGKEVTPALVRRASLALAQALRDLEREMGLLQGDGGSAVPDDDDDDTVLAPYIAQAHKPSPPSSSSTSLRRSNSESPNRASSNSPHPSGGSGNGAEPYARRASASPVPRSEARVPGYVPGMHRPITPQPQSQQQSSASSDYEDYILRTGSPARSNTSTPRATSPMTSPIGREAIHNSITALNFSVNPLTRGTASPLPISRLASNSPSPSFTDSISKVTPEKSLTMAGPLARNPRRSSSPLVYESAGSPRARQAAPVVSSILRSRSPDQSTLRGVNGSEHSSKQTLAGSSFVADSHSQSLTRILSLDRGQSSRSPPLPDSPSIGRNLDWTGYSATSTRAVSPSPLSGFGRAAHQAQQQSPPPSATARSFNESLMGREPPSASSLGAAMRSASPVNGNPPHNPPLAHHTPGLSTGSGFSYDQDRELLGRRGSTSPAPSLTPRSRVQTASPTRDLSSTTGGLLFSPMLNSSRSSLASIGSSFHSWGEPEIGNLQRLYDYEESQRVGNQSGSASGTSVGSDPTLVGSDDNVEEILHKYTGLTKVDIAAMHTSLVALSKPRGGYSKTEPAAAKDCAIPKADTFSDLQADTVTYQPLLARATPPLQNSSPSPGPHSVVAEKTVSRNPSNASKADALLRSVIDSISSPPSTPPPASNVASNSATPVRNGSVASTPPPVIASGGGVGVSAAERKKALTDALFGSLGSIKADSESRAGLAPSPNQQTSASSSPPVNPAAPSPSEIMATQPPHSRSHSSPSPSPSPSPPLTSREPSTRPLSRAAAEKLHKDVQRQATAATARLKSPSVVTVSEEIPKRKSTKKIKTSIISNPHLVSSTTSVDATPIASPSMVSLPSSPPNSSSSKFSLKNKLRGTLRSKQPPTGDEITPWIDPSTPLAVQFAHYPPQAPSTSQRSTRQPMSADPFSRDDINPDFKFPASSASSSSVQSPASPPASAPAAPRGAGLRSFMSRIRRSPRRGEDIGSSGNEAPRKPIGLSRNRSAVATSSAGRRSTDTGRPAPSESLLLARSQSVRALPGAVVGSPLPEPVNQQSQPSSTSEPVSASPGDEAALRQLYDAAEKLGYPHAALNEFLSRSGSVTSNYRNTESRASARSATPAADVNTGPFSNGYIQSSPTASTSESAAQLAGSTVISRNAQDAINSPGNAVVRRTLYVASDATPGEVINENITPARRSSIRHGHKRSASIVSAQSSRSIVDRAPTPPPTKSARRKSQEPSPPVPRLPSSASQGARPSPTLPTRTRAPLSGMDSPSPVDSRPLAANDSITSLGNQQMLSVNNVTLDGRSMTPSKSAAGTALQMTEYANGQVVWSVVDGLRAGADDDSWDINDYLEDSASLDPRRASGVSNTSTAPSEFARKDDTMQLLFREHRRMASKDSNGSYVSKRRVLPPSRSDRPETKVFYSTAAEIEKLIESISRGLEAGSFNVLPRTPSEAVPSLPPLHVQHGHRA